MHKQTVTLFDCVLLHFYITLNNEDHEENFRYLKEKFPIHYRGHILPAFYILSVPEIYDNISIMFDDRGLYFEVKKENELKLSAEHHFLLNAALSFYDGSQKIGLNEYSNLSNNLYKVFIQAIKIERTSSRYL